MFVLDGRLRAVPAGVVGVEGHFLEGDPVAIVDGSGVQVARGLTDLSSEDLERVKGLKSTEIASAAPELAGREVVHRDRLVIL